MESLKALTDIGKELGLEGEALQKFVSEQQVIEREERQAPREARQKELEQAEREREYQREAEKRQKELEVEARQKEMEVEAQREARQNELERAEREREYEIEMTKVKLEAEIKVREMEHSQRLELLEKQNDTQVDNRDTKVKPSVSKLSKIPTFNDSRDEIHSYLNRFERYATAVGWEKGMWATNLSALLSGKALDVYARMPVREALNYDELKSALLKRYKLTEEVFKKRYRACGPDKGETYGLFVVRLEIYLQRWVYMAKIEKSYAGLFDLMVRDQLLHKLTRKRNVSF